MEPLEAQKSQVPGPCVLSQQQDCPLHLGRAPAPLTCEGLYKHTDGYYPGYPAVGFVKAFHQVVEEDSKGFYDAVCQGFHNKERKGDRPAPSSVRHFSINVCRGARHLYSFDRHFGSGKRGERQPGIS